MYTTQVCIIIDKRSRMYIHISTSYEWEWGFSNIPLQHPINVGARGRSLTEIFLSNIYFENSPSQLSSNIPWWLWPCGSCCQGRLGNLAHCLSCSAHLQMLSVNDKSGWIGQYFRTYRFHITPRLLQDCSSRPEVENVDNVSELWQKM